MYKTESVLQSALNQNYKNKQKWGGALVEWLREENRNQKVVSLNPSAEYWIDISHIICCKICTVCLKRPKVNKKEAEVGPFLKIN